MKMRSRQAIACVSVILCLAFTSGQAGLDSSGSMSPEYDARTNQYCGYYPQINISPVLPTQNDTIQITPSGEWPDSCIPLYQSHQIVNNVIMIDAVIDYPGIVCLTVILPWGFTVDVGALPGGSYRVDVYITDLMYGFPTSTLCITKSFTVFTEVSKIYLPVVAK